MRNDFFRRADFGFLGLLKDAVCVCSFVRGSSRKDLIEDGTQGKDIGVESKEVGLAEGLLGGHIVPSAKNIPAFFASFHVSSLQKDGCCVCIHIFNGALRFAVGQKVSDAPIHHVDLSVVSNHDIGRLEVTMKNTSAVSKGHSITDLEEDLQSLVEACVGV